VGYDEQDLRDVGEALDYATHWLRYSDGRELINDVLNVSCDDRDRHEEIVEFLATRAERDVEKQLDAATSHVEHETLDSGAHLYRLDVENHAYRFTYPAPGKTTGKIHDEKVEETGDPVITIGYGPDFAVLRSDGVRLDIPEYVTELTDEIAGGGVSGGGHPRRRLHQVRRGHARGKSSTRSSRRWPTPKSTRTCNTPAPSRTTKSPSLRTGPDAPDCVSLWYSFGRHVYWSGWFCGMDSVKRETATRRKPSARSSPAAPLRSSLRSGACGTGVPGARLALSVHRQSEF